MKRLWWLLPAALLAAGGLLFFGCGGSKDGNGDDDDDDDDNGIVFTLDLNDNWQYGEGYQGTVPINQLGKLKNSDQFKEGEVWYLGVKFIASRDLYAQLGTGLVDTAWDGQYKWGWLTKEIEPEDEDPDDEEELPAIGPDASPWIAGGEEVGPFVVKFEVKRSAKGTGASHNQLVFQTKDTDGTKGTANSGTHGKVTLSFTMFNFADNEEDAGKEPEKKPEEGEAAFTPYVFGDDLFEEDGTNADLLRKAELQWNDNDILPIIKTAKEGSYFEFVFEKTVSESDSIGDIATYLNVGGNGSGDLTEDNQYKGAKHIFSALNGKDTYKVNIEDVIADMKDSFDDYPIAQAGITQSSIGGLQFQIFPDKDTTNAFKSITFYEKD